MPKSTAAALITVLLSASALAQGVPVRINAIATAVADDHLAVRTADEDALDIMLPPGVRIGAVVDRNLDSLQPGRRTHRSRP